MTKDELIALAREGKAHIEVAYTITRYCVTPNASLDYEAISSASATKTAACTTTRPTSPMASMRSSCAMTKRKASSSPYSEAPARHSVDARRAAISRASRAPSTVPALRGEARDI